MPDFQPVSRRGRCPVCLSKDLSGAIPPHAGLPYPLLPVCVDSPRADDLTAPFSISVCNDCGLLFLLDVIDPAELYKIFHSDGIGRVWTEHYARYAAFIVKNLADGEKPAVRSAASVSSSSSPSPLQEEPSSFRLLEVGAGQGKLAGLLATKFPGRIEVCDPQYAGDRSIVRAHDGLFTRERAASWRGRFDAVVSSHTLEHFLEFPEYFENAAACLKPGGWLFTSVPNQQAGFARAYGNMLNFEHPSVCLNEHWYYLHARHGFAVESVEFYHDHSLFIAARKAPAPLSYSLSAKEYSLLLLAEYEASIARRLEAVRTRAARDKDNWLFGASNLSQPLFVYGLEERYFSGVLDNSPLKHGKRLYGTGLVCKKPEEVLGKNGRVRVFLNVGQYNQEVAEQVKKLDKTAEIVIL